MSDTPTFTLDNVGWKPVFQQQLANYDEHLQPARVIAVQRTGLTVAPKINDFIEIAIGGRFYLEDAEARPTVGDWVLVDPETGALAGVLERHSLIKRISPGATGEIQLIAANIDTAFIVTSCNADFNVARLERYLTVVVEARIQPVIVLTKADLCDNVDKFVEASQALGSDLPIEPVNALDPDTCAGLAGWCTKGQSIALLGSSGVGKSTIVNALAGESLQATQAVREDDAKGRHTTTHRSLHVLPHGGVILDSPGMREFQIAQADQGVGHVFADVEALAAQCRFNDCAHASEPGCAVQQAIADGELDARRLQSYFKLAREEQFNTETLAERHARHRQFAKRVKSALADNPKLNR